MKTTSTTNESGTMKTRTISLVNIASEVADYIEYLASEACVVLKTEEREYGRIVRITFAY